MVLVLVLRKVEVVHEVTIFMQHCTFASQVDNGKLHSPCVLVGLRLYLRRIAMHSIAQRKNVQRAFGGGLKL